MNETIRAYLKRRVRWCLPIGIGGWVVIATSIGTRIDNPIVSILGFFMLGGAILALRWIKCPQVSVRRANRNDSRGAGPEATAQLLPVLRCPPGRATCKARPTLRRQRSDGSAPSPSGKFVFIRLRPVARW
jgi:hypothetical protein